MTRAGDPYGKRALFSEGGTPGEDPGTPPDPGVPGENAGRRALFSTPDPATPAAPPPAAPRSGRPEPPRSAPPASAVARAAGTAGRHATLRCSSCRSDTDLSALGLVRRMVPSLWIPGLRWPLYVRCPACTEMTWCALDWRPLLVPASSSAERP